MKIFVISEKERKALFERTLGSGHIKIFLEGKNLQKAINNAIAEAAKIEHAFKAIAFTGMSGALVAPAVAASLKKNLILVRKKQDTERHGPTLEPVEGHRRKQNYIIIDDFIGGNGTTVRRIIRDIRTHLNKNNKCVGIISFSYNTPKTEFDVEKYGG